jgi:tRNA (guanine37-N1)-methyltransferase
MTVPDVLLSGNHQAIAQWRAEQSLERTRLRRSDLLEPKPPSAKVPWQEDWPTE